MFSQSPDFWTPLKNTTGGPENFFSAFFLKSGSPTDVPKISKIRVGHVKCVHLTWNAPYDFSHQFQNRKLRNSRYISYNERDFSSPSYDLRYFQKMETNIFYLVSTNENKYFCFSRLLY